MKICTKCKCEKDDSEFAIKNAAKGKTSSECKECHRIIRNLYYKNNTEIEKKRIKDGKLRRALWYKELKSSLVCSICGESHIAVLQFHHLDPKNKEGNIAALFSRGISKNTILAEIAKCQVVCANCHLKLHWNS